MKPVNSPPEVDKQTVSGQQIAPNSSNAAVPEATITQLIAICRQSADSYHRAAELLVGRPDLAHFFEEIADNRILAADAIEKRLLESGKKPVAEILTAPPSEGWTRPDSETDADTIIEICHESEERTLQALEEALRTLPEDWHWPLSEYSQHAHSALAKLHAWRQGKEAGAPLKKQRAMVRAADRRRFSPDRPPSEEEE
jgi:Domain of unknown function (DUF2383)